MIKNIIKSALIIIIILLLALPIGSDNLILVNQTNETLTNIVYPNSSINLRQNITINTGYTSDNILLYQVISSSMYPALQINQTILVRYYKLNKDNLTVGDIVVFNRGDYPSVSHRMIWRNETHFQAKGDNNSIPDRILPITNISGVVVGILY